jgi:hypothetical protein
MTQIFHSGQPSHGGNRQIFEVMTSTLPKGTLGSVASFLAATLYQGNPYRNHKVWNIVPFERYILHMQVLLELPGGVGIVYPPGAPEFTPVFSRFRATQSLVLCECFVDRCLSYSTT